MTVHPRILASAILIPTRSIVVPTTVGHSVRFQNGSARVNRTEDLPYLLERPDANVTVEDYAMSWMPDVLRHTARIRAQVTWPDGYEVSHNGPHDFAIGKFSPPEEAPVDPIEEAVKSKPAWRKPRSS